MYETPQEIHFCHSDYKRMRFSLSKTKNNIKINSNRTKSRKTTF